MFFKNRYNTSDTENQPIGYTKPPQDLHLAKNYLNYNTIQPPSYPLNNNNSVPYTNSQKRERTPPPSLHAENTNKRNSEMFLESPDNKDQDSDDIKGLKAELQDTRSKMKVITAKLTAMRKERDQLQKENKALQEEGLALQSSVRHMIPGFANTGGSFPMLNELINKAAEFYKCECEELFFDLLSPELSMKGVLFFYKTAFSKLLEMVEQYFKPSEDLLKKTACLDELKGPLMHALRKSYQSTWKNILEKCVIQENLVAIAQEIQANLQLGKESEETLEQITGFLEKMAELLLCFYISDPPLALKVEDIGSTVVYNPMKHEPMDGFIKPKQECIVILPSIYKNEIEENSVAKALVLQADYEMLN